MAKIRIIPVIDMQSGQAVRGVAGRRAEYRPIVSRLTSSTLPVDVARAFRDYHGFREVYVADLDAIAGAEPAWATYAAIQQLGLSLWVDAGVRDARGCLDVAAHGVENCIVALETVTEPALIVEFGKQVALETLVFSLDMRNGQPITPLSGGWESNPGQIAETVIRLGIRRLIVLDLVAVGVNQGPSQAVLDLCSQIHQAYPEVELVTGGGIRGSDDLAELAAVGVSGALVASALHDGRLQSPLASAEVSVNRPDKVIDRLQSRFNVIGARHREIADEIPPGPQRLRGLAGSGKTVILTRRAARIHAEHPDWTVVYVFFTRSIYDHIRCLITTAFREMTGGEPNWDKLRVLHAWGAKDQDGFYRSLCRLWGQRPLSFKDVQHNAPLSTAGEAFEHICDLLEQDVPSPPEAFDAVLIDEGQDLPASFYRLAYNTLRPPKRLYWAYDEAQGISSLIVPRPQVVFGTHADGAPIVDLRGKYVDGIPKAHALDRSYRTPAILLMAGHVLNMGLLRKNGPIQGVTRQEEWKALGYEIVEGDFTPASVKAGAMVRITRPRSALAHPLDDVQTTLSIDPHTALSGRTFPNEEEEQTWVAGQLAHDLNSGLRPRDLLIVALGGDRDKEYLGNLKEALARRSIPACIAGVDTNPSQFRKEGHVTLASVYRAKGNEAWKVYACRFQFALLPQKWKKEIELQKRNEALVALTRAKIWCVVTGLRSPIFDELRAVKQQYPYLSFPAFSQAALRRVLDVELFDGIE